MHCKALLVIFLLLSQSPSMRSASSEDSYAQQLCGKLGWTVEQCCTADKFLTFPGYGGLAAAAGTYGIPFVLGQLGFTAGGVVAGSVAAGWQSTGIAMKAFATLQSVSMTGTLAAVTTKVGVLTAAAKSYFSSCNSKSSSKTKDCEKNNCWTVLQWHSLFSRPNPCTPPYFILQ